MDITTIFQGWGEKILGPILIVIGLFMLDIIKIKIPGISGLTEKLGEGAKKVIGELFYLGWSLRLHSAHTVEYSILVC